MRREGGVMAGDGRGLRPVCSQSPEPRGVRRRPGWREATDWNDAAKGAKYRAGGSKARKGWRGSGSEFDGAFGVTPYEQDRSPTLYVGVRDDTWDGELLEGLRPPVGRARSEIRARVEALERAP